MGRDELLAQLLADLRRPPAGILAFQSDDDRFDRGRQLIRLPIRAPTPVGERPHAAVLVTVKYLVAGLPGDPELGAQRRHLLALEQAGDKPESLVHFGTDQLSRLLKLAQIRNI